MATGLDDVPQHDVLWGLASARQGLTAVVEATCWSLSDGQARTALVEAARLQAVTRAVYLRLLAESARRDVPGASKAEAGTAATSGAGATGAETCTWLAAQATMSGPKVRADLREATALDPGTGALRAMGAHLAAGVVTAEHATIGVRALTGLPTRVVRERRADLDTLLTGHATRFAPPVTKILARHLLDTVCPDRADHYDAEAHQRRGLYLGVDSTGIGVLRGQLDPVTTAGLKAVLDHLSAPHRGPVHTLGDDTGTGPGGDTGGHQNGQTGLGINDPRTPAQRRHDALAEMTRAAAGALHTSVRAGEPPRVVVHTTPAQIAVAGSGGGAAFLGPAPAGAASCEQTGPLTPATLALLACDAVIDRIVLNQSGRVLELTSLGRFFTAAQRRALGARDGGCAFPGCDRPPSWCDAHHIWYWSDGGPTTLQNGVLLCSPHHTEIHCGQWAITTRDGIPCFIPPRHLDPTRRPMRNTVHQAVAHTRRVAQQLHLNLPPGTTGDPDG